MSDMASDNAPNSTIDDDAPTKVADPLEPTPKSSAGPKDPEPTDADTTSDRDLAAKDSDEWDEEESILTWKLLVAVAVVLGVLFVGAFFLFSNKKKDNVATTDSTSPATTAASQLPAIRDAFDRPDNKELGKAGTGEDWQAITGTWGIGGKQAYVVERNKSGPRNVAVLDTGSADGSVSAKPAKLVDGWGLVFRYRGPNAYWYIQWNDQFKAFHVFKVQDGKATEAVKGGVGVPSSKDGMAVKVEYSGPSITLFIDGKPLETINDPFLKAETKVGLFASDKAADTARWAEFSAQKGLNGPPLTAAPDPKAKAQAPAGTQPKAGAKAPGQQPAPGGKTPTTTAGGATPPTT